MATCDFEYHRANREAVYDARGIFLTYVCDRCRREKFGEFRADVLSDPDYWHDEPIDGD